MVGHLLALHVTPADGQDRDELERLAKDVQEANGENVQLAYVDQGYTGDRPADAAGHGIKLTVVKLPEAKRGFPPFITQRSDAIAVCLPLD